MMSLAPVVPALAECWAARCASASEPPARHRKPDAGWCWSGEHPLPPRRGEPTTRVRPPARVPRRPLSSTTPSPPPTAPMPRPRAWRTCCRRPPGAPCKPNCPPCRLALTNPAGRSWRCRRRQDLHQARPARAPVKGRRRAHHRRRHGQHVPAAQGINVGKSLCEHEMPTPPATSSTRPSQRLPHRAAGRCRGGGRVSRQARQAARCRDRSAS
jgi:hypothetical protein